MERIERLISQLPLLKLRYFLVSHIPHIRYLTGFTGDEAHLIVSHDKVLFLCDSRYQEQAEREIGSIEIVIHPENVVSVLPKLGLKGTVGVEAEYLSANLLERLKLAVSDCTFQLTNKVVDTIASVKDPDEIDAIRQAIAISERAFTEVLDLVNEGVTERDLAIELSYRQMKYGAEKDAFDLIIASGPRGALPHGYASDKRIQAGELIVFDWGCRKKGYPSDITRMVVIGDITDRQRSVFHIVRDAQEKALESVKQGVDVAHLDRIARDYITENGFAKEFGHPLGHGLGLDVHSFPRVTQNLSYKLPANTVITVEPGIYIPGWGGIRIEEDVRVTPDGAEILTTLPREIFEVG
jgi:Xaa-Pro aminopeptidase